MDGCFDWHNNWNDRDNSNWDALSRSSANDNKKYWDKKYSSKNYEYEDYEEYKDRMK